MDRSRTAIRGRLDQLSERCHNAGMNLTPQRVAVYKALLESEEHPTPEMLFKKVRRGMPSLSLATVYKALDALEKLDLVQALEADSDSRRYDANMNDHHHLVCTNCRRIIDFYDATFDRLKPASKLKQFTARSVSVKILGLCASCHP
jgi:Fur family peroxide stress response transcriptional regulator